jgi:DNA-binding CsgD family transcriptional regulator/PAS domain-containing protein
VAAQEPQADSAFSIHGAESDLQSERNTLDLIGLIYDAAADPQVWPVFLERLGGFLQTPANALYIQDLSEQLASASAVVGFDPSYVRSYEEHYAAMNPFVLQGDSHLFEGNVCLSTVLCPERELVKTDFFHEWITPQRLGDSIMGVLFRSRDLTCLIECIRLQGARDFGERDFSLLRILMPHLQRAVQLHLRIANLESERKAAADALNRWSMGVILLDGVGQVILMNRMAEAILSEKDGLIFDRHGLHAARSSETTALRRLIQGAIHRNGSSSPGGALAISRASFKRPLSVLITPSCPNDGLFPQQRAAAALFVSDPERVEEPQPELLARLYGLTPAEARVASLLLEGLSLPAVADDLSLSLNTVKTHARRVYEKTTTRGQADLIQSLMRGPASLLAK